MKTDFWVCLWVCIWVCLLITLTSLVGPSVHAQDSRKVDKAMELSGLSVSETFQVPDHRPLNLSNPVFRKLFYRAGQTSPSNMKAWSQLSIAATTEQWLQQPGKFRFQVYSGIATANSIEKVDLEFGTEGFAKSVYVAHCKDEQGKPGAIVLRQPIGSWPLDEALPAPQRIRYHGFFLGSFQSDDQRLVVEEKPDADEEPPADETALSVPVLIANRIQWIPDKTSASPEVTPSMVELANQGVDVSKLHDTVRRYSAKPLGKRETGVFYDMMAAAANSESLPEDAISFAEFMRSLEKNPRGFIGNAIEIKGRVKQCVPVIVDDEATREKLGNSKWYQATVFPELEKSIAIKNPKGEDEIYDSFPVTLCLTRLPEGLSTETIVGKSFRFDGYYYRIWIYPSERTDKSGLAGQVSPLVMVSSLKEIQANKSQLDLFIGALVGVMLLGIVAVAFFVARSRRPVPADAEPLPDVIDTNFD